MDIYRFFHPHHNPRLHSTPLRQQEIGELEQAAGELRKALERARNRSERSQSAAVKSEYFDEVVKAAHFIEQALQGVCDNHAGDTVEDMQQLIRERSSLTGWSTWSSLVSEQIFLEDKRDKKASKF